MDSTALERQHRRIKRLKSQGVGRSTVFVHDQCRPVLDSLKPLLVDPEKATALTAWVEQLNRKVKPTNVAQVRHLSPFRYPGGKTWLVPEVRQWLLAARRPALFVEPFAGGGIVGLSVAAEQLAERVLLCELDAEVAAVWQVIFDGSDSDVAWLSKRITGFEVTLENIRAVVDGKPRSAKNKAFRTIIKNRMQRGGILAAGAGLFKSGEAGKGLASRWYPDTLVKRIEVLRGLRAAVEFKHADGFAVVRQFADDPDACFFVDPPYTVGGGKKAGSRLYTHNEIDHEALFALMAGVRGTVMMTYDDTAEVRELAKRYGFRVERVPMKTTHHAVVYELLILKP